jgi:CNT family concentrative nucleoside transporter
MTGGIYTKFSLQFILGYALAPLTWLMGVSSHDMTLVGQLLGEKIILNEMIGYASLKDLINAGAFYDQKSIIIAVYVLCGFANFSSVGIQIGGIGAIAPNQRKTLSNLGFRALLGGGMTALISATLVAMILG